MVVAKLSDIMSGSMTFEIIISIRAWLVVFWLVVKLKVINELEAR